ncbi:hypothetical protein AFM11_09290 [Mycolicibacterium wolinskyi]|uniref:Gap protein n=1 Tax=Mycolicibacterium wolinskyi TaxID=59750 RepID=A0A132PRK6_9MYCO|nr:GAP family protein [Mycolicibacterium wolinskyi]KWX24827.1 hypothetical protein AFM11_09290 [Mycolicibacterium wolinskyi]
MWGIVVLSSLMTAFNPVRVGIVLLMVSRPRPMRNLFVYWIGCLIVGIPPVVGSLMVLNYTAQSLTGSSSNPVMRHVQVGLGVLALAIALWVALRPLWQKRFGSSVKAKRNNRATRLSRDVPADPGAETPVVVSTLPRTETAGQGGKDPLFRRLLNRIRRIWEGDSLWVALLMGLGTGPPADGMFIVITTIFAAGVGLGTQFTAGIVYLLGTLLVIELILVCHVISPTRTQQMMQQLHDWTRAHFRPLIVGLFGMIGTFAVVTGLGLL